MTKDNGLIRETRLKGRKFPSNDVYELKKEIQNYTWNNRANEMISSGGYLLNYILHKTINARAPLITQLVKNPPAMQETWVQSLSWEDLLEKGKATHSSILAWRIPWTVLMLR